jgi:hypothetical protein
MEFVFVGKSIESKDKLVIENDIYNNQTITTEKMIDFSPLTIHKAKNFLISIIDGLNQKNFGLNTLQYSIKDIIFFKNKYSNIPGYKLFIDSGGYSIIVGDVNPSDIPKFIDCYIYYLESQIDVYDYIFSLDIPVFLNYPTYNTKQNIYQLNKLSLSRSLQILNKYPDLKDKIYFIYQFKIKGQYEIWDKLYEELELKNYVKCWGIGGLVGMRGILRNDPNSNDINFSPFIALTFRCLYDYSHALNQDFFKLHILGIYIKYDRFQIIILEKLFKLYLQHNNVLLTYDSINYFRTAELKIKNLEIYTIIGEDIIKYNSILDVPMEVLKLVYTNTDIDYLSNMLFELSRLKTSTNLLNIDTFVPLNVFSNLQIDKFFEMIINKYKIIELFSSQNYEIFNRKLISILTHLNTKYSFLFTPKLVKCISENLRITYIFHLWWTKDRTKLKLDKLVNDFINKINFPGELL